jgi:hypothetical protein
VETGLRNGGKVFRIGQKSRNILLHVCWWQEKGWGDIRDGRGPHESVACLFCSSSLLYRSKRILRFRRTSTLFLSLSCSFRASILYSVSIYLSISVPVEEATRPREVYAPVTSWMNLAEFGSMSGEPPASGWYRLLHPIILLLAARHHLETNARKLDTQILAAGPVGLLQCFRWG